jgi:hypothetical protein
VDFTTVAATKTLQLELPVSADLKRRGLHLGFIGSNWEARTSASGAFRMRVRLWAANAQLHDVLFGSVTWDESAGLPSFSVLKADASSPGPSLDFTSMPLLSGHGQPGAANALLWPYVDDAGAAVPAATLVTYPLEFEGTVDKVTMEVEPINTQTWQPVSADGVTDGWLLFAFAVVSKK